MQDDVFISAEHGDYCKLTRAIASRRRNTSHACPCCLGPDSTVIQVNQQDVEKQFSNDNLNAGLSTVVGAVSFIIDPK